MLETIRKLEHRRHESRATKGEQAPLPPRHWSSHALGFVPEFRADPVEAFARLARRYGDITEFRMGARRCYFVRNPDAIKRMLIDNRAAYGKNTVGFDRMRTFMGEGLVTSQGDFWKRQRRIAQPAFHKKRIAGFADTMVRMTKMTVTDWRRAAERGESVDVARDMTRLTLRIVANTVLSIEVDEREDQLGDDVAALLHHFEESVTQVVPIHEYLPTAKGRALRATIKRFDDLVNGTIEQRRKAGGGGNDLLGMLMDATDEDTGERMDDVQLRDEVLTMFLAGHETTANALAWCFHLLGRHPEVVSRLQAELDANLGEGDPSLDDLAALPYTSQVLEESMRIYPPVWLIARSVEEDDELCGCRVRAGSQVFYSPYLSHRDPRYWPDPERFDPERFDPALVKTRPRYAYFPFSGGPRQCIGDSFARMEAKFALAMLVRAFTLAPVPGHPVVREPTVTLRARHGVLMTVAARD